MHEELLKELDWCIAEGLSSPRTHALIVRLRSEVSAQSPAQSEDDEQQAFEAWVKENGRGHLLELDTPHRWYKDLMVTAWWSGWKARATRWTPLRKNRPLRPSQGT